VVVPYSNWYVVAKPFGFTVPLKVAVVTETPEAAPVVTVGAGIPSCSTSGAGNISVESPTATQVAADVHDTEFRSLFEPVGNSAPSSELQVPETSDSINGTTSYDEL
jgi:hypothetical protein